LVWFVWVLKSAFLWGGSLSTYTNPESLMTHKCDSLGMTHRYDS
jgi:hypothetical protein